MRLEPIVETEDEIYSFAPANNGAGPLWCHGSTIVVRQGEQVFVAGLETLPDQPPLNNCRWLLFRRAATGWELVYRDTTGRTREPSPVAVLGCGDLLVSANPTLAEPGAYSGPARPTVFRFRADAPAAPPSVELPAWRGAPAFTEHSYRTVAADRDHSEVLYMQNVGYDVAHLSLLDRRGRWQGMGELAWPAGDDYDPPRPLRLCYPNVVLRDRSVHFFGVGDIVEPVPAWREAKLAITRREWDYVFRRLFYAWTPDITRAPFSPWLEVASREATAGHLANGDLHVDAGGRVHLLWCETTADERLRERFFPHERLVRSLEYLTLENGAPAARRTLARAAEGEEAPRPHWGRFHVLPDGHLLVVAAFGPNLASATPRARFRAMALHEDAGWVDIPFVRPLQPGTWMTNTVRGGSAPSDVLDLVGMSDTQEATLGYARVRLLVDS